MKKRLRKEGVAGDADGARPGARRRSSHSMFRRSRRPCTTTAERSGRKMGDVVNPLRVAVTGQGVGPGLYDCLVDPGPRRLPEPDCPDAGDARTEG